MVHDDLGRVIVKRRHRRRFGPDGRPSRLLHDPSGNLVPSGPIEAGRVNSLPV